MRFLCVIPAVCLSGCRYANPVHAPANWLERQMGRYKNSGEYVALDILAGLAMLAAVVLAILWGVRCPIPPYWAVGCVALAVSVWILKFVLVTYMWLIAPLAVATLVAFCITLYHANGPEIRRMLRIKRNRNANPLATDRLRGIAGRIVGRR